jgi:hypothetical protein
MPGKIMLIYQSDAGYADKKDIQSKKGVNGFIAFWMKI